MYRAVTHCGQVGCKIGFNFGPVQLVESNGHKVREIAQLSVCIFQIWICVNSTINTMTYLIFIK